MTGLLRAENLDFSYNNSFHMEQINLDLARGDFMGIIGPNGSGKSTLLKLLAGYLRARSGRVLLEGKDIVTLSRNQVARKIAVVSQGARNEFEYTVEDIVRLGRLPYLSHWQSEAPGDAEVVKEAMDITGVTQFRRRLFTRLSGGEAQRVLVAQALAQQPGILLLDEPTTHLDMAHQQELFGVLTGLNRQGVTILAVLHDLNMAALYCSSLTALKGGRVFASGSVEAVVTAEKVSHLYGCRVEVTPHPHFNRPQVLTLPPQMG
jgi:iron complex transport system ATP-binding protein